MICTSLQTVANACAQSILLAAAAKGELGNHTVIDINLLSFLLILSFHGLSRQLHFVLPISC